MEEMLLELPAAEGASRASASASTAGDEHRALSLQAHAA